MIKTIVSTSGKFFRRSTAVPNEIKRSAKYYGIVLRSTMSTTVSSTQYYVLRNTTKYYHIVLRKSTLVYE